MRVVYENRWMRVHEDRLEGGGLYGWVEKPPAALIVRRFSVDSDSRMVRENVIRDAASVAAWHLAKGSR